MISLWIKLIFFGWNFLSNIDFVKSTSDPNRMPAPTSIDITVTRGSCTPCGDQILLNVQDPDTGLINQYPAAQVGSCLNPLWHVSIPTGLNTNTAYKCWPSRGTDNSQSVAMLPNGQIAYNKCGTETFQRPQTLMVVSWSDLQGNGLPSTSSSNMYMLYSSYPISNCDGITFPVWIRLPTNYSNQKRCSTIIMYEANCYFDKSRCTKGYEYNVDDQLNRMESTGNENCFIALLFGTLEGQNTDSCPVDNYLQATKEILNNQASSLPVNADPSQNILFGIEHGAAMVFQALPIMFYWAWQCMIINPIYSDRTGQQAMNSIQNFVRQPSSYAANTNCVITAPSIDPATNQYTRPLADMLTSLSPFVDVRFMRPKNTYYSMRPVMITFDMTIGFQKLADNAKKSQMCLDQTTGTNQRKKRDINARIRRI